MILPEPHRIETDPEPRGPRYFAEKYSLAAISRPLRASVEADLAMLRQQDRMEGRRTNEREAAKSVLYQVLIDIQRVLAPYSGR